MAPKVVAHCVAHCCGVAGLTGLKEPRSPLGDGGGEGEALGECRGRQTEAG